jgi:hypothetical protein
MKEIPSCEPEDYAKSLIQLFDSGLITFESDASEDDVSSRDGLSRLINRIARLVEDKERLEELRATSRKGVLRLARQNVRFRLTEAGGQQWERLAEPNWDHYFGQLTSCDSENGTDKEDGELISQNLNLLMAVLGWFQETDSGQVDLNSIEVQKLDNYPILYWKRLPSVYRITFNFLKADARWNGSGPAWLREPEWYREWWNSRDKWYKRPWDLPVWPSAQ